jgi:TolA-binding protein
MQEPNEKTTRETTTIVEKLSHAIHGLRFVLWGILIVAAVLTVGWFVWSEVNKKVADTATKAVESAQEAFEKWSGESDAEKKKTVEKDLAAQLDDILKKYPRQYGGQRALFMRAELYFEQKAWDKASSDYLKLARSFPASYLAGVSLFNAAVCAEEQGDVDGALKAYEFVLAERSGGSFASHSLFSIGRLQEQKNAPEEAKKAYDRLVNEYPDSGWTNYAKNRIMELRVAGKIK